MFWCSFYSAMLTSWPAAGCAALPRSKTQPRLLPGTCPLATPLQVCDSLNDILRPAAYQAVPLLASILAHSGSEGAKQVRRFQGAAGGGFSKLDARHRCRGLLSIAADQSLMVGLPLAGCRARPVQPGVQRHHCPGGHTDWMRRSDVHPATGGFQSAWAAACTTAPCNGAPLSHA